jgi:hypothetical protein
VSCQLYNGIQLHVPLAAAAAADGKGAAFSSSSSSSDHGTQAGLRLAALWQVGECFYNTIGGAKEHLFQRTPSKKMTSSASQTASTWAYSCTCRWQQQQQMAKEQQQRHQQQQQ